MPKARRARVALQEAPHKRSICETKMRYDVLLDGTVFDTLYFNMRGYLGSLPLPGGGRLEIGERGISAYRAEVRALNRQFAQAAGEDVPTQDPTV